MILIKCINLFFFLEREVIYQQATESMIITYMEFNYQHCDISGIFEGDTETLLVVVKMCLHCDVSFNFSSSYNVFAGMKTHIKHLTLETYVSRDTYPSFL